MANPSVKFQIASNLGVQESFSQKRPAEGLKEGMKTAHAFNVPVYCN